MDEKRKAWCEKYKVEIADGGFIDVFCGLPEHVEIELPNRPGKQPKFIGFDGRVKSYEELTEEEKQDFNQREQRIVESLQNFHKTENKER